MDDGLPHHWLLYIMSSLIGFRDPAYCAMGEVLPGILGYRGPVQGLGDAAEKRACRAVLMGHVHLAVMQVLRGVSLHANC